MSPQTFIFGVWTWLVVAVFSTIFGSAVLLLSPVVHRIDPQVKLFHWLGTAWARCIVFCVPWWRFTLEGKEHLASVPRPVVFVANHQSQADIFALYFLGEQFRWIAKDSLFRIPIIGTAMRACRYVAVSRHSFEGRKRSIEESRRHLLEGISMAFFPEGTRREPGSPLKPFKRGAFLLAAEQGVPVVPIALSGTEHILPRNSVLPRAAKVRVTVLPPILPAGQRDDADRLARLTGEAIAHALKFELPEPNLAPEE